MDLFAHESDPVLARMRLAAALPGIEYAISVTHVLEDDLMKEPFTMKHGFYEVPTAPGLGVHLDDDAIDRYRVA